MISENKKCDICVNIYGKYYQTLVSLKTLLQYNKEYINKIFIILEKNQPEIFNIDSFLKELQYDNVEVFSPKYYFGFKTQFLIKLTRHGLKIRKFKGFTKKYNLHKVAINEKYRQSIRYQYAFEKSQSPYMFLMHNDIVFHKQFLDAMIQSIDDGNIAVGSIGQCWNCPLSAAGICSSEIVQQIQLTYDQVCAYIQHNPSPRTAIHQIDKLNPLPMPECRLNEWAALINCHEYKKITLPNGTITPFGKMGFDIGTDFYRETLRVGYRYENFDTTSFSTHGYFSKGCGNQSLFNINDYTQQENAAQEYLAALLNKVINAT